ncbi:hypothetical protein ACQCSX_21940 (plasmid) [Pseudarthrobacter sp. P1]|uniref:hypothetical protein n=1 Tax=Pseudarthrobacter sp. P1 TaxID=3418418 RepID=UPI003CF04761
METFYGHVNTLEQFFSYGPDCALRFEPFNDAYGTVHPDSAPGTGKYDVELILNDGEYFQVQDASGDVSRRRGGNFLDYRDAYKAALTCGEYGGIARITIRVPAGTENVTALAADGTAVIMGRDTKWRSVYLPERIRFLNRPATDPEAGAGEQ